MKLSQSSLSPGATVPTGGVVYVTARALPSPLPSGAAFDRSALFSRHGPSGVTYRETDTFTVMSLDLQPDVNLDLAVDSGDDAALALGWDRKWAVPANTNLWFPVKIFNDVALPGTYTLTVTGSTNVTAKYDGVLTKGGQTNAVSFPPGSTEETIEVQASGSGIATLALDFKGSGSLSNYVCRTYVDITVYEVKVEFLHRHYTTFSTNALQVAKWDNAFTNLTGGVFQFRKSDFINGDSDNKIPGDADRFRIRVTDGSKTGDASVTARLRTEHPTLSGYDTGWRTLTLPAVSPGVFISTNLLLVSDQWDAAIDPAAHGLAANIPDRIFNARLGSAVQAEYKSAGSTHSAEAIVGVDVETVIVDVAAMHGSQQGINITDVMAAQLTRIRERLAQVNIAVEYGVEAWFNPPAGINLGQWEACAVSNNATGWLTPEARAVLAAASAALPPTPSTPRRLRLVLVPSLRVLGVTTTQGLAVAPYFFTHPGDEIYHGYSFLSIGQAVPFLTAHEVGHILTDEVGHNTVPPWNVMWSQTGPDTGGKGQKRLMDNQDGKIRIRGKAYFK